VKEERPFSVYSHYKRLLPFIQYKKDLPEKYHFSGRSFHTPIIYFLFYIKTSSDDAVAPACADKTVIV
jgi:hypothetical protein